MFKLFKKKKKKEPIDLSNAEGQRFLIVESGCPFCAKYFPVIQKINMLLSPERRIKIINVNELEWNINFSPIIDLVKWKGTPFLYISGIVSEGITTKEYAEGFLMAVLEKEFLIQK